LQIGFAPHAKWEMMPQARVNALEEAAAPMIAEVKRAFLHRPQYRSRG
jgi:hypothetical protein